MTKGWVLLSLLLGVSPRVSAQGTITDGPASFTIGPGHFGTTPVASLTGVSTPLAQDHLFEEGWWYRVSGEAAETAFPSPDTQDYTGDTATLAWSDVNGAGFAAQKVWTVADAGGPSGQVIGVMTLTNNTPGPLDVVVFHMADVDLAGTADGDVGSLIAANDHIGITDGSQFAEYRAPGAGAYLVRPFGDPGDVAGVLSDADADDFDDSGLPFGPGDLTLGFQWPSVSIPPGGQQSYTVVIAVNVAAVPVDLTNFSVE